MARSIVEGASAYPTGLVDYAEERLLGLALTDSLTVGERAVSDEWFLH
jgi:hypothetical protein